jgi:rod shape-determining protein MreB
VGAKEAYLIEEPMAAAIGAGLAVEEPRGNMVVDVGGGTSDIAVISLGGLVVAESLRMGGDAMDEAIIRYVRKKYNLEIGSQTAEALKISIGNCCNITEEEKKTMAVKGRDVVLGLPRQVELTTKDMKEAIEDIVSSIIRSIRRVLELTPAELSADIIDRGIVLTGGGALLKGLSELIHDQTGIKTYVADSPLECVALGTGKALDELKALKESGSVYSAIKKSSGR